MDNRKKMTRIICGVLVVALLLGIVSSALIVLLS